MLKPIFLSAFIFLGMATAASAAPLLSITKNSGFVPPRLAYRVECSVGPSSTLRRIRMGQSGRTVLRSGPTRYTPAVPDSRRALALIAAAARGRIMESSGPTDMPTSSYYGFFSSRRETLFVDQSYRKFRNMSPGVGALLELGNRNCPTPR